MKTGIYTVLGIIGIILCVVMFMTISSIDSTSINNGQSDNDYELAEFLPAVSSVWEYSDSKTFKKLMVTERLYVSDKFTHLIVKGEEDDRSIKSFNNRYQFEYTYKVDDDKIVRSLQGMTLIDPYKEVVILKNPIVLNNSWRDTWIGKNNETYSVTSTITAIENDGQRVIVESIGENAFVLTRALELGKGIVEVHVLENYDDVTFETGFQLLKFDTFEYEGFDTYMALLEKEKIGTEIATITSTNDAVSNKESDVDSIVEEEIIQEDSEIDVDVKDKIIESVQLFNDKWIDFINENDMAIMDTITPNASVEAIIEAYKNKEMTQKFLKMEFKRIVLQGKVANAYVYEEIERTMDGVTEVLTYNWIYEIDEIDGKWLVEGYIENNISQ